jgi:hypothetical protein
VLVAIVVLSGSLRRAGSGEEASNRTMNSPSPRHR